MERLKLRQRLEKLNTPTATKMVTSSPSEKARLEPTKRLEQVNPFEMRNSELAGKSRVQSIILNSIPDRPVRPHKPNSHVTPQMIADFQFQESKPIEINGQIYRMHPASIPEPDFEPIPEDISIAKERINEIITGEQDNITAIVDALEITKGEIAKLRVERDKINSLYNKHIRTFKEEILVAKKNKDYKKGIEISRQSDELERQYLYESRFIEDEIDNKIRLIDELQIKLQQTRAEKGELETIMGEQAREIFSIKERNAKKLKEYEDNLKQLNRDFNLQQQPYESEEDYLERIRQATSAIEDPSYVENRMLLHDATKFKNNLKDFIRDPTTIEYAYNAISQDEERGIGAINELNNLMPLIKSRYERTYGINQIKDVDLVKFLLDILSNPTEAVKQEEKEIETPFGNKYKALELKEGRRAIFSKPQILERIELLYPYSGDVTVDFKNKKYILSKGLRGALKLNDKAITQANLPELRVMLVAVMEKLKVEKPRVYEAENEEINRLSNGMYGEGYGIGVENIPKLCQFGQVEVDLHKLFYKNILSIKQKGLKINGFRNAPVSDEFVSIVLEMCKGHYPTARELNKLPERQLYDTLLHIAGIHKKVEHTADRTVEELHKRLTLVEGEIEAGNTNRELLQELKDILYNLHHLGVITQNNMKSHFNDIKQNFF